MQGSEMRQLVATGTCPQCGGELKNKATYERLDVGSCDICNIKWASTDLYDIRTRERNGLVEAVPL